MYYCQLSAGSSAKVGEAVADGDRVSREDRTDGQKDIALAYLVFIVGWLRYPYMDEHLESLQRYRTFIFRLENA